MAFTQIYGILDSALEWSRHSMSAMVSYVSLISLSFLLYNDGFPRFMTAPTNEQLKFDRREAADAGRRTVAAS